MLEMNKKNELEKDETFSRELKNAMEQYDDLLKELVDL